MSPLAYTEVTKNGTLKKNETAPPTIRILSRAVGGKVNFSCPQGFAIQGAAESECLPTGKWSVAMPLCKGISNGSHSFLTSSSKMSMMMPMSSQFSNNGRNWNNKNRRVLSRMRGGGSSAEYKGMSNGDGGSESSSGSRGTESLSPMRTARQ